MRDTHAGIPNLFGQTIVSYWRYGVHMVVVFLTTPLMVERLGPEQFGLWVLVFSTLGFLGLLDMGLASSVVKLTAQAEGNSTFSRRNHDLSTVAVVYTLLGLLSLSILAIAAPRFHAWLSLPTELADTTTTLVWLIGLRSAVLLLPFSLFRGVLFGASKIHSINAVQLCASIAWGGSAWVLLMSGRGLVALAWANLLVMLCEHLAYAALCFRSLPDLELRPTLVSTTRLRPIVNFSGYAFMAGVAGLILLRTDPLIVQLTLSLGAVALYTAALKIVESATQLVKQFTNLLAPAAARLHASHAPESLAALLVRSTRLALLGGGTLTLCLGLYAPEILRLWLGTEFLGATTTLRILLLALLVSVPQLIGSAFLTMTGDHRFTGRIAMASAGTNVALSLLMARPFGIVGIASATLLSTLLFDLCAVTPRTCRRFDLSLRRFTGRALIPTGASLLPAAAVGLGAKLLFGPSSWLGLLGSCALVGSVGAGVFVLFFLEPSERTWLRATGRRLFSASAGPRAVEATTTSGGTT